MCWGEGYRGREGGIRGCSFLRALLWMEPGTLELLRGHPDADWGWQLCAPGSTRSLSQKLFLFEAFLTLCIIQDSRLFAGSLRAPRCTQRPICAPATAHGGELPSFPTHRASPKSTKRPWHWPVLTLGTAQICPRILPLPYGVANICRSPNSFVF